MQCNGTGTAGERRRCGPQGRSIVCNPVANGTEILNTIVRPLDGQGRGRICLNLYVAGSRTFGLDGGFEIGGEIGFGIDRKSGKG